MRRSATRADGSPTSIDQPGKTIAQGLMGVWMALHQGPATADVCMIIGSNPLISIAAGLPQADPRQVAARRASDAASS